MTRFGWGASLGGVRHLGVKYVTILDSSLAARLNGSSNDDIYDPLVDVYYVVLAIRGKGFYESAEGIKV